MRMVLAARGQQPRDDFPYLASDLSPERLLIANSDLALRSLRLGIKSFDASAERARYYCNALKHQISLIHETGSNPTPKHPYSGRLVDAGLLEEYRTSMISSRPFTNRS